MKQLPVFHNEDLAYHIGKIHEAAAHRLKNLDKFCEDIKTIEKLFRSWCISTVGPVFLEDDEEEKCEGLVWNEITGRVGYGTAKMLCDDVDMDEFMETEKPLIECSASVRRRAAKLMVGDFLHAVVRSVKGESDVTVSFPHVDKLSTVTVDSGMMLLVDPSYVLGRKNGGLAEGKTWNDVCDALGNEGGVFLRESVGINGYMFNMPGDGFYDVVGVGQDGETAIVGVNTKNDMSEFMKDVVAIGKAKEEEAKAKAEAK